MPVVARGPHEGTAQPARRGRMLVVLSPPVGADGGCPAGGGQAFAREGEALRMSVSYDAEATDERLEPR